MAADLDISAPYVALLERNQRPVTADMLLRLARTSRSTSPLAGDGGADNTARLQSILKEPMFSDIDIPALEISDLAVSYSGMAAFLRSTPPIARSSGAGGSGAANGGASASDPDGYDANDLLPKCGGFAARRNNFPVIDDAAERIAQPPGRADPSSG
jgi:hypothetical protein